MSEFLVEYQKKTKETLRSRCDKKAPEEADTENYELIFKQSLRCHHQTRFVKTKSDPSNHLKNTQCPFEMTFKIHNKVCKKKRAKNSYFVQLIHVKFI